MAIPTGPHTPTRRQKRLLPSTSLAAQDVLTAARAKATAAPPRARQNFLEAVPERFYTVAEVALKVGVTEKTIRNHIRDGRLKASHAGRRVRIPDVALLEYLRC